jgi:hypothetical protein
MTLCYLKSAFSATLFIYASLTLIDPPHSSWSPPSDRRSSRCFHAGSPPLHTNELDLSERCTRTAGQRAKRPHSRISVKQRATLRVHLPGGARAATPSSSSTPRAAARSLQFLRAEESQTLPMIRGFPDREQTHLRLPSTVKPRPQSGTEASQHKDPSRPDPPAQRVGRGVSCRGPPLSAPSPIRQIRYGEIGANLRPQGSLSRRAYKSAASLAAAIIPAGSRPHQVSHRPIHLIG